MKKIRALINKCSRLQKFYSETYVNQNGRDVVFDANHFNHKCYIQELQKGDELISSNSGGDYRDIKFKIYTTHPISMINEPNSKVFFVKKWLSKEHLFLIISSKEFVNGLYYLYTASYYTEMEDNPLCRM